MKPFTLHKLLGIVFFCYSFSCPFNDNSIFICESWIVRSLWIINNLGLIKNRSMGNRSWGEGALFVLDFVVGIPNAFFKAYLILLLRWKWLYIMGDNPYYMTGRISPFFRIVRTMDGGSKEVLIQWALDLIR